MKSHFPCWGEQDRTRDCLHLILKMMIREAFLNNLGEWRGRGRGKCPEVRYALWPVLLYCRVKYQWDLVLPLALTVRVKKMLLPDPCLTQAISEGLFSLRPSSVVLAGCQCHCEKIYPYFFHSFESIKYCTYFCLCVSKYSLPRIRDKSKEDGPGETL